MEKIYVYTPVTSWRRGAQPIVDWRFCERHWTERGLQQYTEDRSRHKRLKEIQVKDATDVCHDCLEEKRDDANQV